MFSVTKIIRTTGRIDKSRRRIIEEPLPLDEWTPVELIIIPAISNDDDISEAEWMRGLASNPVFED
ncbi:MAG: hypothetical protein FJY65_03535 [Calditrichaeota bacterium]|nr:hypothetical protein [Calditrichota bacterium]